MKLNREETILGTIVAYGITFWIGWIAIPMAFISGFCWSLSGAGESKLWRRLGVPAIIVVQIALKTHFWWCLASIPVGWLVLCIGYGTPSLQPPDSGSALGRFYWKLTKENTFWTDVLTRGTIIGLLYLVVAIPFIIKSLLHNS